jgi:hypothetical protein
MTDWNSAVGMFLRLASSWVSVSTVLAAFDRVLVFFLAIVAKE